MALPAPLQNAKTVLSRFTLQQKIVMAGSAIGVMLLLWAAVVFSNRVNYEVLFTDLDPQEAQGIIQKLQGEKAPYQLSDDGRTIRVGSEKLAELRIKLASEGLPSTGRIGFEIFDQTNLGLTNFQEQVNYQRALEGELARSIMTLSEVEGARVHLVMSRESLFQTADDQAKASVVLKLKNGRNLSAGAVQGIVNVVAGSVKGLAAERVTLIDIRGKILSRPEGDAGLTGAQVDVRQKLETEMSAKIMQILEPAAGAGKVRPQVAVNMNFQQVEETTERYDPQGSVVRSEQRQEDSQPLAELAGGIPGPKGMQSSKQAPQQPAAQGAGSTAAPPAAAPPTPSPVTAAATRHNETINYEVSKSTRHTVEPVGTVSRLSVAVLVDNRKKLADDGKTHTSEPRTSEEMRKYRDIVAAAVGFNAERGDRLTIENVSFEEETEIAMPTTFIEKQAPMIMTGLRYLIIPLAFIVIYILFLKPLQRAVIGSLAAPATAEVAPLVGQLVKALPPANVNGRFTPMTVKQLEAQLQSSALAPTAHPEQLAGSVPAPLPTVSKTELLRTQVMQQASEDPETVARLIRSWLNKREG